MKWTPKARWSMSDAARTWVESAFRSLDAAEILYAAGRWPQTCFHARQ
ncbi:MAG: hypothetical protein DLM70_12390 [Chloroflexi bacterium]|nr:MAG: hypothetical protein DLM70_12390 [Chloroflexota bacterium]